LLDSPLNVLYYLILQQTKLTIRYNTIPVVFIQNKPDKNIFS